MLPKWAWAWIADTGARNTKQASGMPARSGPIRSVVIALCSAMLAVFVFGSLYDRKLTAQSTGTKLYVIGTELVDLGAYADAAEVLEKAAYMSREDAHIFLELGNAAYFSGGDATAFKAWDEAIRLDPTIKGKAPYAAPLTRPAHSAARSPAQEKLVSEADKVWRQEWRIFGPTSKEARVQTQGREKQNASLPHP